MLSRYTIRELLGPFELNLSDEQLDKLSQYLALLLRWNKKINLTAVRKPEECVTRHFGESLLLSKLLPLRGRLLDIGSGAGFPGLAIKILAPELQVVLLEPIGKKRAFLKEAARTCGLRFVDVLEDRIQEFSNRAEPNSFDIVTARAVGGIESLAPVAARLLKPGGWLCLWVGNRQGEEIIKSGPPFQWMEPVAIPLSHGREILAGKAALDLAAEGVQYQDVC